VVLPVSTGLVPVVNHSVVQSACRCLLAYWYRFLLLIVQLARRRLLDHLVALVLVGDRSVGMPPLTSLTPVVHIAGSTGLLLVLLFTSFTRSY
jgi:hypothetical protein